MPQVLVCNNEVKVLGESSAAKELAHNNCFAYAEEGLSEHKGTGGKHLEGYWRQGMGGIRPEDWEDKAAQLHELEEHARQAREAVVKAAAVVAAYNNSWGYQEDQGASEHKGKGRLAAYWRKGHEEGEEDYEDEAARLQELEEHVKLGLEAKGALAAAAAAVAKYNEAMGYADGGLAEHKAADGKHLDAFWRKGIEGIRPADWADKDAQLHELEANVQLGQDVVGALAAAAAAVAKYNENWGYTEDKGPAEHKGKGRLAAYWRKGYTEGEEDYEDEEARLHELEKHVKLGLEAKEALATATSAMATFSDSIGYAEEGLAEHKGAGGKHLDAHWHKGMEGIRSADWEDKAAQLHEFAGKA
ncbi:hypothetical protein N2152v2_009784 [Parachlorella kessleri]